MFNHLSRITVVCLSVAAMASAAEPVKLPMRTERVPSTVVQFEMIKVPAGSITLQRGEESKTVEIKSIWIGKHEVTWDEYDVYYLGLDLPDEMSRKAVEGK